MADVYLAEQGSLRRQIAFKVLKRELADDQTYVRRFHMEAQAAAALVQANIVQIYEVGCVDGWHYIAQEYVEGQNLAQYIARQGTPDVKLALAVMRQVAAALCKSAERGIVHRDIKPENIMLGRSGEVKVADFGLARVGAGEDVVKLTQVGITMGTPLYMSPEQVEGRPLDARSDIYSLGVTCFHMLSGQPPFRGDTALSVALQHVGKQPDRLENSRPDLPASLCRIVHKMLAKDPAERFQSPRDLLRELRGLQVEGIDLGWPAEMDEFNSVETAALGTTRLAATQRLQTIMNASTGIRTNRTPFWYGMIVAGAVAASLLIGGAAAWAFRSRFMLDTPPATFEPVQKMQTAAEQYDYAQLMPGNVAAWESVEYLFPSEDDKHYALKAKQGLVKLYFQQGDLERAVPLLNELASAKDKDSAAQDSFRAFGLAGLAFYHWKSNDFDKSTKDLTDLAAIAGGLSPTAVGPFLREDPQMARLVVMVLQKNRQLSSKVNAEEWDKWLQTQSQQEEGG